MSILIEQGPEELKKAVSLHQKAEMSGVRLSRCNAEIERLPGVSETTLSLDIKFGSPGSRIEGRTLGVDVEFMVSANDDSHDPTRTVFSFLCKYEMLYELREGYDPTPEEIAAFSSGNAIFNCWPYFRELAQNMISRMGVDIPPVPFLRVLAKPAKAKIESKTVLDQP